MERKYIFIVGMPRSGTTLLSATLTRSGQAIGGAETQFFNKCYRMKRALCLLDPFWPQLAVATLKGITLSEQKVLELYGVSRESLYRQLFKSDRSTKSMFDALMGLDGSTQEKIVVEKTPNHLLHVDEIRKEIRGCKFIRIVRDPRGSAVSMKKLPWASADPVENAKLISTWHRQSRKFFSESHEDFYTVRYESWMKEPQLNIENICEFSGITFDQKMLSPSDSDRRVMSMNEPWKNQVNAAYDISLTDNWREQLNDNQSKKIMRICSAFAEEFGYAE